MRAARSSHSSDIHSEISTVDSIDLFRLCEDLVPFIPWMRFQRACNNALFDPCHIHLATARVAAEAISSFGAAHLVYSTDQILTLYSRYDWEDRSLGLEFRWKIMELGGLFDLKSIPRHAFCALTSAYSQVREEFGGEFGFDTDNISTNVLWSAVADRFLKIFTDDPGHRCDTTSHAWTMQIIESDSRNRTPT